MLLFLEKLGGLYVPCCKTTPTVYAVTFIPSCCLFDTSENSFFIHYIYRPKDIREKKIVKMIFSSKLRRIRKGEKKIFKIITLISSLS